MMRTPKRTCTHGQRARYLCKECCKEDRRAWHLRNPGKAKEYRKTWLERNPETQDRFKKYMREKYRDDPAYREEVKAKQRAYKQSLGSEERSRRNRARWLKFTYNITMEQFQELCDLQDNKCPICDEVKPLVVDHNHITGEVRGLLCQCCNLALGQFGDEAVRLKRAIHYLRHHKKIKI